MVFQKDSDEDHGKTCVSDKKIWINTRYSIEVQRETLLHELLHVSLEDCPLMEHPIEKKEDNEEYLVRYISPRLFQILRDNPKIKEFVLG